MGLKRRPSLISVYNALLAVSHLTAFLYNQFFFMSFGKINTVVVVVVACER